MTVCYMQARPTLWTPFMKSEIRHWNNTDSSIACKECSVTCWSASRWDMGVRELCLLFIRWRGNWNWGKQTCVDWGHVLRGRDCCSNPAVWYSITTLNQATATPLAGAKVCNETQLLSVCFHHGRHYHGIALPDIHRKAEEMPNNTSVWAEWHRQDNCTPLWVRPSGGGQFTVLSWSLASQGVSTLFGY